jgi:glycosyltransferase involved in cell wall biosynthesis
MVREAIEAALGQSHAPDEIVISDDASSDQTCEVLDEIAARDSRVRVLRRAVNSGGVENWNAAMRETHGDFIAWCSDDDRFAPGHLAASLEFLERHPEIGMVHSSFIDRFEMSGECDMGDSTSPAATGRARGRDKTDHARPLRSVAPIILDARGDACRLARYMIRYYDWPFHPSTLVMRREVWQRTGEFDPVYALADTDWFVRASAVTRIAMLPRHGVINRRHAGNWSNRVGSAKMQGEIFEIVEKTLAGLPLFRRVVWRTLWRANVRARLGLTLRARLRSGHGDAACAAWHAMLQRTGRHVPEWMERLGAACIRRFMHRPGGGEEPVFEDTRGSVSPL